MSNLSCDYSSIASESNTHHHDSLGYQSTQTYRMARRIFLVTLLVLVLSTWIFEVEVEAKKEKENGKVIIVHNALSHK